MSPVHRPLSAWIAHLTPSTGELDVVNGGDDRADARDMDYFADGWKRVAVPWGADSYVLGLTNDDDTTVVELDDYGAPITISLSAISVIDRVEQQWPVIDQTLVGELQTVASESLPVRYWLLERLNTEGDPPDDVFTILPWELLDRVVSTVLAGLESDSQIGELVEIQHWLTPAVQGLTAPLEQLDHGVRTGERALIRSGAFALLANLRDIPTSRIPAQSRAGLSQLVTRLGSVDQEYRESARVAAERLAVQPSVPATETSARLAPPVPDWERRWEELRAVLDTDDTAVTIPGEVDLRISDTSLHLHCEWEADRSVAVARLSDDRHSLLPAVSMLFSGPDQVNCLLRFENGAAVWSTADAGPYTIRLPEWASVGGRTAYEAVSLRPVGAPAFGSQRRVLRQRTVVPSGPFRMDAFEDSERNLELAIRSDDPADAGTCALVSIASQAGELEDLAVPLTWLGSLGMASGSVKIGRVRDQVTVFVVPELVQIGELDLEVLDRSLSRVANAATRIALERAVAQRRGEHR